MVFPASEASVFSDLTLMAQTAGFLILIAGTVYARRKNFIKHDKTAKIAVTLGGLSFIWMGFSFVHYFLEHVAITAQCLLIISHAVTGILALFLGIFLVLDEIKKTKARMIAAILSWSAAMLLGVIKYIVYFII